MKTGRHPAESASRPLAPWHALDMPVLVDALGADPEQGLADAEAERRQSSQGPNVISEGRRAGWLLVLARQFTNFLIAVLAVAAAISYALGDTIDAIAILVIVILNGLLGFAQEWKAEVALRNLKVMLGPTARVIRGNRLAVIDASRLVSGDLVVLEAGDRVPADLRLIDAVDLKADESALTGESLPVDKTPAPVAAETPIDARRPITWMGTHIVNGHGRGLVTGTGMDTELGRIASLTERAGQRVTRLQRELSVLARQITVLIVTVTASVVLVGWLSGRPPLQMLLSGIALAVAAVPEGLPAVVTISLALGLRIMARHRALLRRLQTAETLGATSVICTDKTGTLTKNEMTIQRMWTMAGAAEVSGAGYEPVGSFSRGGRALDPRAAADIRALIATGLVCNHAQIFRADDGWAAMGSPTEAAFISLAHKAGIARHEYGELEREFSFNSARKLMSVIEQRGDRRVIHTKGAPEVVLAHCERIMIEGEERALTTEDRGQIQRTYREFAGAGLRTLGLATKQLESGDGADADSAESALVFLGLVGMMDPPRPEVPDAIQRTRDAGIRVLMVTGDAPETARAVADAVGLAADKVMTGAEIANLTDEELLDLLERDVIFARMVPEQKFRLVKLLQSRDQLVAMTGDGVNDAPALHQADIGIAMGIRGTDVARGAADMVLSDDNFASIVHAIEEGRRQYANISKSVGYLVSTNFGETMAVFLNILSGSPLILLPIQILWVNLVTDSATALSLGVEPAEPQLLCEPPRNVRRPILTMNVIIVLLFLGTYIAAATLGLYTLFLAQSGYAAANSIAFTAMVTMSNIGVFNFRSFHQPLQRIGWLANRWMLLSVVGMLGLQALALHLPVFQRVLHTSGLDWRQWLAIILTALPPVLIAETYKNLRLKRRGEN